MRIRRLAALLAVPLLALPTAAARAQNITYTFSWTGAGTLGGANVNATTMTLVATGPVAAPTQSPANLWRSAGLSASLTIAGVGTYAVTAPIYVFNNFTNTNGGGTPFAITGFGPSVGGSDFVQIWNTALVGYDLKSAVGPVTAASACPNNLGNTLPCIGGNWQQLDPLATSGGNLVVSSLRNASFRAEVAVPEPSTWALLATGLGAVALVARRRSVPRG